MCGPAVQKSKIEIQGDLSMSSRTLPTYSSYTLSLRSSLFALFAALGKFQILHFALGVTNLLKSCRKISFRVDRNNNLGHRQVKQDYPNIV